MLAGCATHSAAPTASAVTTDRAQAPVLATVGHATTPAAPSLGDLVIPRAAPTRLVISALGIDAAVEEYTDAQVAAEDGWVDPVHRDIVAWWSGGGTPGNPSDNTVYLYGHVSSQPAVFNALADAAVGQLIEVTTSAGTLTYSVTDVLPPVLKSELPDVPDVAAAVPGRLVLIGCHRDADQGTKPTTKNNVVIAQQLSGT